MTWRSLLAAGLFIIAVTTAWAETKSIASGSDYLVCGKPDDPQAPTFRLEIAKDAGGTPTELRVVGSFDVRLYRVTKATGITIAAEELDPPAPDAVGRLFLDRVTGRLITENYISFSAVAVLVKFCDGQIDGETCRNEMSRLKDGNPFACFNTHRCERWRSKSNLLAVHMNTCEGADRKF